MAATNLKPIPYIRECFSYELDPGVLWWRERPLSHFTDEHRQRIWNSKFAKTKAGHIDGSGYIQIRVDWKMIQAHHIIWALMTGEWPKNQIDHRNGKRDDNRFSNLREATPSEQNQNVALRKDNQAGLTGVHQRGSGRWRAAISARGRRHSLGSFDTKEEAHAAYLDAKNRLHQFQPQPRC